MSKDVITKTHDEVNGKRISSRKKIMPRSVMYERQKTVDIVFLIILLILVAIVVYVF